jgi:hypothetical protein
MRRLSIPKYFFLLIFSGFITSVQAQRIDNANPFFVGHSLVNFDMPQMVNELAKAGGKTYTYNQQIINGAPLWWNFENYAGCEGTPYVNAFPTGNHDALILTEAVPLQNHLDWSDTYKNANRFYRYSLQNNNGNPVRFYLYETWHCIHTGTAQGCEWDNGDSITWQPRLKRDYGLWKGIVDEVRKEFPENEVWMVPAGQAFYNLTEAIKKGELPGISDFRHFFTDDIHLTHAGNYFVALVMYACIFRDSPAGLPTQLKNKYGNNFPNMPTAAQAAVMQRVAWETAKEFADVTGVETTSRTTNLNPETQQFHLFPNPATHHVKIISDVPVREVHVYNQSGQMVWSGKSADLYIEHLENGLYYVEIISHNAKAVMPLVKM